MKTHSPSLSMAISVITYILTTAVLIAQEPGTRDPQFTSGAILLSDPIGILEPDWVAERQRAQLETKEQFGAFIDFSFTDGFTKSGIDWVNRVVDDAGYSYKAVHYDHGNGMAVNDVNGDGHLDIYFVNQIGSNALFKNNGDGTFEDMTNIAGLALNDRISVSASFADVDNDGLSDLFVTSVRSGNKLFKNLGNWEFKDITQESWLEYHGHSSGAVFFDYDRDGWLDLFLTNVGEYTSNELRKNRNDAAAANRESGEFFFFSGHADGFHGHLKPWRSERSILYRNNGNGTFSDVSEQVGLIEMGWTGDALSFDGNNDGWPDLYITNMQGHDGYWENQKGESFVRKTFSVFGSTPWGAMGVHAFDWDQNGYFDIYVTDMHSDMSKDVPPLLSEEKKKSDIQFPEQYLRSGGRSIFGNAFFQNNGDGTFNEVSDQMGAENYWPWGLSVGDLNADGYEDAFVVSSMNYGFRYHPNTLLINDGGKSLKDAEYILGVEPRDGARTAIPWFEVDSKSHEKNHPAIQEALQTNPNIENVSVWGALGGRSSAIFDVDSDGDLDIVTNDFNSEPTILISNLSERKPNLNYLKVSLRGTSSNREGFGAIVRVRTGDQVWSQLFNGKSGYLSQSSFPLYFGLGPIQAVDSILIEWPSGKNQTINGPIQSNQLIDIEEEPGAPAIERPPPKPSSQPSGHNHGH